MRLRRIANVIAGLVGAAGASCFAPEPPSDVPCASASAPERCPAGMTCVQREGGIEVCTPEDTVDPPDTDRDGDGVLDSIDNCPDVANPDQANEDGDALGDACDPCPPFDGNDDADGDGVGDACDPSPQIPGDKLVSFVSFAGGLPADWKVAGPFVARGGDGVATTSQDQSALFSLPSPATPRVEIRAAVTLDAITATGTNLGGVGVLDRLEPNTDKAVVCQLSALPTGGQQQLRIFDSAASTIVDNADHALLAGTRYELRLRRNGTSYTCRANNPVLELAGSSMFSPAAPRIGLRTRGANARYHWVMVVSTGP